MPGVDFPCPRHYRAWTRRLLEDGRYRPGVYVHAHNAQAVYDDMKAEFAAAGVTEEPRIWVASGRGWEEVTDCAIGALVRRGGPIAAILWGRDAQSLRPALGSIPWVESAHPSPLSAARGFFGSRPFSRVNRLLTDQDGEAVDWSLPSL